MLYDQVQSFFYNIVGIITLSIAAYVSCKFYFDHKKTIGGAKEKKVPISVNYHFSRKCNYSCGFCFHTAKTSHILSLDEAKIGLRKLKEAGQYQHSFT